MRTYQRLTNALTTLAILFQLGLSSAHAQNAATPYPKMAPIEQYMMERDAEIALARSAAPDGISKDASVLVLTRQGFETAVTGKSGWTCYVDRGWAGMLDHPEFWNPKIRAALCLNPAASRSFVPYERLRARLILEGKSKQDIVVATAGAIEKKQLPKLEPGSMCYMMSKTNYLTDEGEHAMPHVMFYTADRGEALGANLPHSPFMGGSYWSLSPDAFPQLKDFPPICISIMMADEWADGTPSSKMKM
jgi:hypothetical protein